MFHRKRPEKLLDRQELMMQMRNFLEGNLQKIPVGWWGSPDSCFVDIFKFWSENENWTLSDTLTCKASLNISDEQV